MHRYGHGYCVYSTSPRTNVSKRYDPYTRNPLKLSETIHPAVTIEIVGKENYTTTKE